MIDAAAFSSHDGKSVDEMKDYDFMRLEIDPANKFVDRCLKNTRQHIQLAGNHCHRIERFCIKHGVPGLASYQLLSPEKLLGRGRGREFKYVPYVDVNCPMSYYPITKDLVAIHGWSFAKHAAQVHLDKSRSRSVLFGHTHRQQVASTRDPFTGKVIKAFNPGTLSKLIPLYATGGTPTDWSHGFALIYCGHKSWTEYMITIENGACVLPSGQEIII